MKKLEFSTEEVETILRALGIAEMTFNELRKQYLRQVVNVRGVENLSKTAEEADIMLCKENEFCDLLLAIKHGERDA